MAPATAPAPPLEFTSRAAARSRHRQTRTRRSSPAVARRSPPWEKSRERTGPRWPPERVKPMEGEVLLLDPLGMICTVWSVLELAASTAPPPPPPPLPLPPPPPDGGQKLTLVFAPSVLHILTEEQKRDEGIRGRRQTSEASSSTLDIPPPEATLFVHPSPREPSSPFSPPSSSFLFLHLAREFVATVRSNDRRRSSSPPPFTPPSELNGFLGCLVFCSLFL